LQERVEKLLISPRDCDIGEAPSTIDVRLDLPSFHQEDEGSLLRSSETKDSLLRGLETKDCDSFDEQDVQSIGNKKAETDVGGDLISEVQLEWNDKLFDDLTQMCLMMIQPAEDEREVSTTATELTLLDVLEAIKSDSISACCSDESELSSLTDSSLNALETVISLNKSSSDEASVDFVDDEFEEPSSLAEESIEPVVVLRDSTCE
jgi:hypothetical protein